MVRKRRQVEKDSPERSKKFLYLAVIILLGIILFTTITNTLKKSLFFADKDRLNLIFYAQETNYYSLGINTEGQYAIPFEPDLKLQIPGGYGEYRVGALGKLLSLEKNPKIIQRTFSLATYSFLDYYFYDPSGEVYYGTEGKVIVPTPNMIWRMSSNASILDKVYLMLHFLNKDENDFHSIPIHTEESANGEEVFAAGEFEKRITGYLFQKSYRNEKKSVQIYYTNQYVNAERIGKMLQGNGIRIGDISQTGSLTKGCIIQEDSGEASATALVMVEVFDCKWKKGDTEIYDILFMLGEKEKEWEIKS